MGLEGVYKNVIGEKGLSMLVVGCNAVGAWVLLVIVSHDREHVGHCQ